MGCTPTGPQSAAHLVADFGGALGLIASPKTSNQAAYTAVQQRPRAPPQSPAARPHAPEAGRARAPHQGRSDCSARTTTRRRAMEREEAKPLAPRCPRQPCQTDAWQPSRRYSCNASDRRQCCGARATRGHRSGRRHQGSRHRHPRSSVLGRATP
eukprot:SAG31_NODE_4_length_45662_cov_15.654622_10_plen_155_part_00